VMTKMISSMNVKSISGVMSMVAVDFLKGRREVFGGIGCSSAKKDV
jgi:hypothetical protein